MRCLAPLALLALLTALTAGCRKPERLEGPLEIDYERPLPPGEAALRKLTDPAEIPDFTLACTNLRSMEAAIDRSLSYLAKPSSHGPYPVGDITHEDVVKSLRALRALVAMRLPATEMNAVLRLDFDVYISIGCDDGGTVLFTGYYTPIFDASPVRRGRFRHPLYAMPPALVKNPDGSPATPMPDRRTIESEGLYEGLELVWLADPFAAYVCHVQGSARLRMPDGTMETVGYAAHNGHAYRSLRAEMVERGLVGRRAGLPAMLAYFAAHPDQVRPLTWQNPRFIFFEDIPDGRPRGCLNEPVMPWRSIATDKSIFPPAAPAYVETVLPQHRENGVVEAPYRAFMLDQDAGGAIRAPGRADVYLGVGDAAGDLAGRAMHEGRLYYLILKPGRPAPALSSLKASSPG